MKENKYHITILLILSFFNINGQTIANNESLEHVLKIQCTSMCTYGNGIIVGIDSSYIYAVTALHVVDPDNLNNNDSDSIPKIELKFKKREIGINKKIVDAFTTDDFEVVKEYSDLDLAVLKVKHHLPDRFYIKKKLVRGILDVSIRGEKPSFYLDNIGVVTVNGYPAGAAISIEYIKNQLYTTDFFDNLQYFKIAPDRIQSGHSGSPVYANGYFVGILRKTSQNHAMVLHLKEILLKLREDKINHDLLVLPKIMNYKWRIDKVEFLKTQSEDKIEFIEKDTLTLQFDSKGKMTGFLNGKYKLTNNRISITDIANGDSYFKSVPSKINPGLFKMKPIIFENSKLDIKNLNVPFGFNFSPDVNEPIFRPLEKLIIGTQNMNIYLEEIRK